MSAEPLALLLPSLGEVEEAELVQFQVAVGDEFAEGDTLAVIESDKATLEVPAPRPGRVLALKAKLGDAVGEGHCLLEYETLAEDGKAGTGAEAGTGASKPAPDAKVEAEPAAKERPTKAPEKSPVAAPPPAPPAARPAPPVAGQTGNLYAGPAVRRLARKLGVALDRISGTGNRGRIQLEDLYAWVRQSLQGGGGVSWPETPWPDLAKQSPVERKPLGRIQRVAAKRLHAGWVNIPQVTQQDEADVSDLEQLRARLKPEAGKRGTRLTPLAFIVQAAVRALRQFPLFRSALEPGGEALLERDCYHIGIAVDTPKGLLVPVIRDVHSKDLYAVAAEAAELATTAREGKLTPAQMAGAVFTISSLGHLGGTGFTPLVNAPEVAILGISAMHKRPYLKADGGLAERLMLPLSLSYDHRVINGVQAVEFTRALAAFLGDGKALQAALDGAAAKGQSGKAKPAKRAKKGRSKKTS